jgi:hypothetical protein
MINAFTHLLHTIAVRAATLLAAVWSTVLAALAPATPALIPVRTRRGAGFLEWALLGALALTIAAILWRIFPSAFEGLLNSIRDAIGRRS